MTLKSFKPSLVVSKLSHQRSWPKRAIANKGGQMAKQKQTQPPDEGWPIYELWTKYEDIAMHFNDLLIKLRTQALAAVAALTTIVGIFAKSGTDAKTNWEMVAFALLVIIVFWIAIWIIDFCYYNRLLVGAVKVLFDLEVASKDKLRIHSIDLST